MSLYSLIMVPFVSFMQIYPICLFQANIPHFHSSETYVILVSVAISDVNTPFILGLTILPTISAFLFEIRN